MNRVQVGRVRDVLSYDAETGVFRWKVAVARRIKGGDIAGSECHQGYWVIRLDKRIYKAHRLAWLYVHGEWPAGDIDHINGVRLDNRIANLRDVSRSVNIQNLRRARSDNKCGLLGVSPHGRRWRAVITLEGQRQHIGHFDTPEIAHQAYLEAKLEIHEGCTLIPQRLAIGDSQC